MYLFVPFNCLFYFFLDLYVEEFSNYSSSSSSSFEMVTIRYRLKAILTYDTFL